jgi:glutamyl-tRNA reductase
MLIVHGVSHRTASVEVREAAAIAVRTLLATRPPTLAGVVPLLTCNRVEVYADAPDQRASDVWRLLPREIREHGYSLKNQDALHHLARVATGLDSVVLGETQIISQVATALRSASSAGTLTAQLRGAFRIALRTAERARAVAWCTQPPASIGSAAAQFAGEHLASLRPGGAYLVIVGAGHVARAVASELSRAVARSSVRRVTILNRSIERAVGVGRTLGAHADSLDALRNELRQADVVIAATSAPEPIINVGDFPLAGDGRPRLLIDAGVPRNIDPSVSRLTNITLLTVDSLGARASDLRRSREGLVPVVEELVSQAVFGTPVNA